MVCTNCGTENETYLHRVQHYDYTCPCELKNYEELFYSKYKNLIGDVRDTDTVTNLKYQADKDANNRAMLELTCSVCGTSRLIPVQQYISRSHYKMCNCKPRTSDRKNPSNKYNQLYLHKRFGSIVISNLITGN